MFKSQYQDTWNGGRHVWAQITIHHSLGGWVIQNSTEPHKFVIQSEQKIPKP